MGCVCVRELLTPRVVLIFQAENICMLFAKSFFNIHIDDKMSFYRSSEQRNLVGHLMGHPPGPSAPAGP